MAREFMMPGKIISGPGALEAAEKELKKLGKKALIVTDPVMVRLGNASRLQEALERQGVAWALYGGVTGEPTDVMIRQGLRDYREENCDFLIGLGGGSPIDTMKAIAAMAGNSGDICNYMGKEIGGSLPPMAAVPTTAGTGSEATWFTIITDTEKGIKMLLKGSVLMPSLAVIDPYFTMTAPPDVTASTGLDALCHAVEAFTSRKAQPLSDTFARSAVRRIFQYLPKAFHDGSDGEARVQMSLAALEAGVAFNNSSVTLIHGMSRPIGALFHVAHGLSNAMLLKECLGFALEGAYGRFAELGRIVRAAAETDDDETAAEKFLAAVVGLTEELKVPSPAEYGIDRAEFMAAIEKMAQDAMDSGSPQNTMRAVAKEDVKELYMRVYGGKGEEK